VFSPLAAKVGTHACRRSIKQHQNIYDADIDCTTAPCCCTATLVGMRRTSALVRPAVSATNSQGQMPIWSRHSLVRCRPQSSTCPAAGSRQRQQVLSKQQMLPEHARCTQKSDPAKLQVRSSTLQLLLATHHIPHSSKHLLVVFYFMHPEYMHSSCTPVAPLSMFVSLHLLLWCRPLKPAAALQSAGEGCQAPCRHGHNNAVTCCGCRKYASVCAARPACTLPCKQTYGDVS
jgi:hypothetical protein